MTGGQLHRTAHLSRRHRCGMREHHRMLYVGTLSSLLYHGSDDDSSLPPHALPLANHPAHDRNGRPMCSLNQLLTLRSGGSAGFIHAYKLANTPDPGQVVNVLACVGSDLEQLMRCNQPPSTRR
ncbi:hypothetical protein C8J57DRAFT_1508518 [Mycena rebaudengoi]|nr:hypothetical protein C8J57DRAFT_1508518 [Mycena rebaudengoi]